MWNHTSSLDSNTWETVKGFQSKEGCEAEIIEVIKSAKEKSKDDKNFSVVNENSWLVLKGAKRYLVYLACFPENYDPKERENK